eukprot:3371262-Amphidinium_carterae.1
MEEEAVNRNYCSRIESTRSSTTWTDQYGDTIHLPAPLDADVLEEQRRNDATIPRPVIESTQSTFSGPSHRLDADPSIESASAVPIATVPPSTVPKALPKTPPPALLVQSPPQPVESAASQTTEEKAPLLMESEWNNLQIRQLRDAPLPNVPPTGPPTIMPSHMPRLPEMPVIPPDALAQDVDLTQPQFPVFGEWKKAIDAAPYALSRDAQLMEGYKPIGSNIEGFGAPVDRMMELKPASGTHVYIPIPWNADCVTPPYLNFYLDGHRIVP